MPAAQDNATQLCDISDSTLLLVDLQVRLMAAMPNKVLSRVQRNAGQLLKSASILDIPVYATEQYPQGLGNTEPEMLKLFPQGTRMYEKTAFSATGAEGLLSDLKDSGRRQVILGGMEAHVCVLQTALELLQHDYQVFVVADAICSRQRENYETAIQRLRHAGASVCDAESVLFEWLRDAGHEHFKTVQALLR